MSFTRLPNPDARFPCHSFLLTAAGFTIGKIYGQTFESNIPAKTAATAPNASNVATAQSAKPSFATAKPSNSKTSVKTAMIIRPPADQKAMPYSWAYNYDTLLPLPPSDEVFKKKVSCKPPPVAKAK